MEGERGQEKSGLSKFSKFSNKVLVKSIYVNNFIMTKFKAQQNLTTFYDTLVLNCSGSKFNIFILFYFIFIYGLWWVDTTSCENVIRI